MADVGEGLGNGFHFAQQFAKRRVAIFVDSVLCTVSHRYGVAGAVEVVDIELVGLRVDHGHQAEAVDVVALDLVGGVGFGQQVAAGVVDVFCDGSVAGGDEAVAHAVVLVAVDAVSDEAVGAVEAVGGGGFAL